MFTTSVRSPPPLVGMRAPICEVMPVTFAATSVPASMSSTARVTIRSPLEISEANVSGMARDAAVRSDSGPHSASDPGSADRATDASELAAERTRLIRERIPSATALASDRPADWNELRALRTRETAEFIPLAIAERTPFIPDVAAERICDMPDCIAERMALVPLWTADREAFIPLWTVERI